MVFLFFCCLLQAAAVFAAADLPIKDSILLSGNVHFGELSKNDETSTHCTSLPQAE